MCIKINHFEREYVKLFSPDDKFIGDVDELQLLDIQCQICEKNLSGYRDWETDRKSTRLNSSHSAKSRMPSSA